MKTINKNKKLLLGLSIATIFALGLVSYNTVAYAGAAPGTDDRSAVADGVSPLAVVVGPSPFFQHNVDSKSISLYFGVDTLSTEAGKPQAITIDSFTIDATPSAKFTLIEADVQAIDAGTTNPVTFNTVFKDNIVENDGDFWTTFTTDVSAQVLEGETTATIGIDSDFDCLVTQGFVFEEGSGQPASYAAAGVGLRGQASGIINIAGIPADHLPVASYLYWNVLNPDDPSDEIDIDGNTVTAILAGSDTPDPCWGQDSTWGFVANVTSHVSGNGAYTIDNLPTGLNEGATLVVVHQYGVQTCDANENICKTVFITQENEDGVIAVNELVTYDVTVNAVNNLGEDINDAMLKDNFGGDVEIVDPDQDKVTETGVLGADDCDVKLKGKTEKAQVRCDIGTFADEAEAGFTATVQNDINPGQGKKDVPKREYTSCGIHDMNSGATLSGVLADGTLVEFSTGSVSVEVFEFADLSGDCDGDGLTDFDEINTYLSDPFTPNIIILDTALVGSPGGSITEFGHHLSTGISYGGGNCPAESGSVFVLDNGYISISATGILRSTDCIVPTTTHDNVHATLHCDEGDIGPTSTVPLSSSAGATTEGDFDLTDSLGAIGTCTNVTVYVESGPPNGNGKWLAQSP